MMPMVPIGGGTGMMMYGSSSYAAPMPYMAPATAMSGYNNGGMYSREMLYRPNAVNVSTPATQVAALSPASVAFSPSAAAKPMAPSTAALTDSTTKAATPPTVDATITAATGTSILPAPSNTYTLSARVTSVVTGGADPQSVEKPT
jgi:hypothetical protein